MKRLAPVVLAMLPSIVSFSSAADESATPDTRQVLKKMRDNAREMEAQLIRFSNAKTDEERQRILTEHMRTMRENMLLAHGMGAARVGCPMMDDGVMERKGPLGGAGAIDDDGAAGSGSPYRMRQIEKRLDAMERMMEQMPRQEGGSAK